MIHKYFDLFTVACWDHSARLVLKMVLKNLHVQQSLCLFICLHTYTSFLQQVRPFPLPEPSVTVPQLCPSLWMQNCINARAYSLPSLYHFHISKWLTRRIFSYISNDSVYSIFTKHSVYCNCKRIRPNGVSLTNVCLVLYFNQMCNITNTPEGKLCM